MNRLSTQPDFAGFNAYNFSPTLSGYQQVYSERGRLYYLPEALYNIIRDDTPNPSFFQPREQRPHRIHIARIHPDWEDREHPNPKVRRISISVFFTKLSTPKNSAKKFFKAFIFTSDSSDPHRDRPLSWISTRSTANRRPHSEIRSEKKRRSRVVSQPIMRQSLAIGGPVGGGPRHSIQVDAGSRRGSVVDGILEMPMSPTFAGDIKMLASGNGVAMGIALAEPVLYLQGYETGDLQANRSTAMLRGSLQLRVSKPAKLKAVTLRFRGRAITKWPEGIPPKKTDFEETTTHMSHTWPFFNAQFPTAEHNTGADRIELNRSSEDVTKHRSSIITLSRGAAPSNTNSNKELKRLSLQVNQARSFEKGSTPSNGQSVAQKGYRTFQPGEYYYNFELPIDSHLPETIDVELGSVKYELEAIVERAGAFKTNLIGTKEVTVIRTPSEGSLETVEPIAISRNWEDQLHYDIVISGKSFPLGAQVPIAFKLTPLAKVQCHRIKIMITESVEYYCNNKRVHRMEPTRKIQLFEKRADSPPTSTFPGSTMRIISGGGVPYDLRAAAARGDHVTGPENTNLLGNLEQLSSIGPTEMEFNVQLPSCINTKDKDKSMRVHFDTTYQNIQVHHWIKIVMRLSRPDANDPAKRRHFEISIDSPFHILSCQATQANTALPAYSRPDVANNALQAECGCPGAPMRRNSPQGFVPTMNSLSHAASNATMAGGGMDNASAIAADATSTAANDSQRRGSTAALPSSTPNAAAYRHTWQPGSTGLQRPQAAHVHGPQNPALQRPIHIIRAPSFMPPSFDDEEPPPPLETPPPHYEDIASPTNGMADYFARLSDRYSDDVSMNLDTSDSSTTAPTFAPRGTLDHDNDSSDSEATEGARTPRGSIRVEQPLTPGALRSARSLDEARTWLPIDLTESDFSMRRNFSPTSFATARSNRRGQDARASNTSTNASHARIGSRDSVSTVATADFVDAVTSPTGSRAVSRAD